MTPAGGARTANGAERHPASDAERGAAPHGGAGTLTGLSGARSQKACLFLRPLKDLISEACEALQKDQEQGEKRCAGGWLRRGLAGD